jgi:RNA polymerase sigma-70 factor, ECF subfamily
VYFRNYITESKRHKEKIRSVQDSQEEARFDAVVLPHLDAAFNPARWILRSGADGEDASQEAMLRAYRFFDVFRGGDVRA